MNELTTIKKYDLINTANMLQVGQKTKETYVNAMISFKKFCLEKNCLEDLDSLKSWLYSTKTPATQAIYIAAVKKVFSLQFKGDPRLVELQQTLAEIKPVKRNLAVTESKYLKKDEVEKLIAASPTKIALMIKTLFVTGLRISELLDIRLSDCSSIRDGQVYEVKVLGKGSKENTVYISKALYDEIGNIFGDKTFLFGHDGLPYRREYISNEIKRIGVKIGKNISAHTLRHSRAHDLLERGVSIDKVSKFLNHSSITTTASFYLHTKPTLEELQII
jgi:integrase